MLDKHGMHYGIQKQKHFGFLIFYFFFRSNRLLKLALGASLPFNPSSPKVSALAVLGPLREYSFFASNKSTVILKYCLGLLILPTKEYSLILPVMIERVWSTCLFKDFLRISLFWVYITAFESMFHD